MILEPDSKDERGRRATDNPDMRRERIEALRGVWAGIPGLGADDLLALRSEERKTRSLLDDRS